MIVIRREGKIPGRYLLSRYDFPEQHLTQNTQPHKMVKYTQKIWRLLRTNYLGKFEHFVGLALKGLRPIFDLSNLYIDTKTVKYV